MKGILRNLPFNAGRDGVRASKSSIAAVLLSSTCDIPGWAGEFQPPTGCNNQLRVGPIDGNPCNKDHKRGNQP